MTRSEVEKKENKKRVTFKSYSTLQSTLNILTIKTSTNRTGGFVMISANWKWPSAREVQSSWCSSAFSASRCHLHVSCSCGWTLTPDWQKWMKPLDSFISFGEDLWNCNQGRNLELTERRGEDDFFLSHYSLLISINICFQVSYFQYFFIFQYTEEWLYVTINKFVWISLFEK